MERADRLDGVTYAIRDVVLEARNVDKEILHLNIGDPLTFDFETPRQLKTVVEDAMQDGWNGYAPSDGIEQARAAVATHMQDTRGTDTTAADVLPGYGASEGIHAALTSLVNPGENVLTPSPGYPQYTGLVNLLNGEVNTYRCDEAEGWNPDVEDMREQINEKTRAIVVINPNNPTGATYTRDVLQDIVDLAGEHNLPIIADEIYSKLVHHEDRGFTPVASLAKDVPVLTMSGLSKNYLVPGWRTGWTVRHDPQDELGDVWAGMQQLARLRLSTNHPFQYAIPAALNGSQDHLAGVRETLRSRAQLVSDRINDVPGLSVVEPRAAFYAFAKIGDELMENFADDKDFVYSLLHETGVLTVHGSGFGNGVAENHFRIVFLPEEETLREACDKIQEFVDGYR